MLRHSLLTRRVMRPSSGPSMDINNNPKLRDALLKEHNKDTSFDIDKKGTYWRIKPLGTRRHRRADQSLNNVATMRRKPRTLMTETPRRVGDALDVTILDDMSTRAGAFAPLAFHHFLHGVGGRDAAERNPLLVRGALKRSVIGDAGFLKQALAEQRKLREEKKIPDFIDENATLPWSTATSSHVDSASLRVPFAVTNARAVQLAFCPVRWFTSEDESADGRTHVSQSPLFQPIAPFSRAARHARLIGKVPSKAVVEAEEKSKIATTAAANNNIDNNSGKVAFERGIGAWDDAEATSLESIVVGGGAAGTFHCSLFPPNSDDKSLPIRVFLTGRDALYVPRLWRMRVACRQPLALSRSMPTTAADEIDAEQAANTAERGELDPFLLRFSYSAFPETGPRARKSLGIRQYVGSEFSQSFGNFYRVPLTSTLSISQVTRASPTPTASTFAPLNSV